MRTITNNIERRALATFKALELTNATIHLGYDVDKDFATYIHDKVVISIKERVLNLGDRHIDLKPVFDVIQEGLKLFVVGRNNPAMWHKAMDYSDALCHEYKEEMLDGLKLLLDTIPNYPVELAETIATRFLYADLFTDQDLSHC